MNQLTITTIQKARNGSRGSKSEFVAAHSRCLATDIGIGAAEKTSIISYTDQGLSVSAAFDLHQIPNAQDSGRGDTLPEWRPGHKSKACMLLSPDA